MTNRSELLAEALYKTNRVSAKISRIHSSNGAVIAGTEYDTRVSRDRIKRYNSKQLEAYIERQNRFLRRNIQFEAGYRGVAIPRNEWKQYQRAEREINAKRAANLAAVADIPLPNQSLDKFARRITIGMERSVLGNSSLQYFESNDSLTRPEHREVKSFVSSESLIKMRKFLERQRTTKFEAEQSARGEYAVSSMLGYMGDNKLVNKFSKLSSRQMDILWNYTEFAANLSLWYEEQKLQDQGKDYNDDILSAQGEEVDMYLNWAGKL